MEEDKEEMTGSERLEVDIEGTEEEAAEIIQAALGMYVEEEGWRGMGRRDSKVTGSHRFPDSGSKYEQENSH